MNHSTWSGVFPAVLTQLHQDQSLDHAASAHHWQAQIDVGVAGLIVCGSLGENQCLQPEEKRAVVKHAVEVAAGRVPVISGVAEMNTRSAISYMQDCEKLGAGGFMIMPPMVYIKAIRVRRSNGFAHSPKPRRCPGCSTTTPAAITPMSRRKEDAWHYALGLRPLRLPRNVDND